MLAVMVAPVVVEVTADVVSAFYGVCALSISIISTHVNARWA